MKCIIYISKTLSDKEGLPVPVGLAKIYSDSRKTNSALGITSILTHKNGYYLQALEGDSDSVDEVFKRIQRSRLHKDIVVILNSEISQRYFQNLSMRLVEDIKKDTRYLSLINDYNDKIENLNADELSAFNVFHSNNAIKINTKNKQTIERIGLKKWPSFNKIKPTPVTLELCAKLVGNYLSHEEIYSSTMSAEQIAEYDMLIAYFRKLGLIVSNNANSKHVIVKSSEEEKSSSFYAKMKMYLSRKMRS